MKITRTGQAGINVFTCPICKGAHMGGVLFVGLGLRDYARMRVNGSVTRKVACNNENHTHTIEVILEPPKGARAIETPGRRGNV